jgi:hypothetical protein
MRTATLLMSLVVLCGCESTGSQLRLKKDASCVPGEKPQQRPTLLERMGLRQAPVKKAQILPPVPIERTTEDAFTPALSPELAPYVRPGSLQVDQR